MAVIWLAVGPVGAKIGGPGHAWLGMYADKAMLPWLLLAYLPGGIAALVVGSLASRPEYAPPASGLVAVLGILLGMLLLMVLPTTGWLLLGGSLLGLIIGAKCRAERDTSGEERFYLLMATPVGREQELVDKGIDVVYAGASEGHPWELNHPKLVQWGGFAVACGFTAVVVSLLYWIAGLGR